MPYVRGIGPQSADVELVVEALVVKVSQSVVVVMEASEYGEGAVRWLRVLRMDAVNDRPLDYDDLVANLARCRIDSGWRTIRNVAGIRDSIDRHTRLNQYR